MTRGKRTKTKKQDLVIEICDQLNLPIKNEWKSTGSTITADAFEAILMKIAENTGIPPNHLDEYEKEIWRLRHKSINSMILSLETINRITIENRLESFLFLFINAWELLMKSKIIKDSPKINSIKDINHSDKTISFKNALYTVFPSENNVIRKNLLRIEELRNNATHLYIPLVPPNVLFVFQAGILNYEKMLNDWLQYSLTENIPYGMMFLISDIDPSVFSLDSQILRKHLTPESLKYLREWQDRIIEDVKLLPEDQIKSFIFQVNLNLSIVNNPSKADVLSMLSNASDKESAIAIRFQQPIEKYPLSYTELVSEIKKQKPNVKNQEINEIIKKYNVKSNSEYSYFNFVTKKKKEEYEKSRKLPSGIISIYNYKAVRFILDKL